MKPIKVIRSPAELEGTAYFEFLPGPYRGDHWVNGSVFVQEQVFCLIESALQRHHPGFDHYSSATIPESEWVLIIRELEELAQRTRASGSLADLREAGVGFHRHGVDAEFEQDLRQNSEALAELAEELAGWLRGTLADHEVVSVLGM
jgi:hypothetical protein